MPVYEIEQYEVHVQRFRIEALIVRPMLSPDSFRAEEIPLT